MPLPTPGGESQDKFISRCMGNPTMQSDFPDEKQRLAVCFAQWNKEAKTMNQESGEKMLTDEAGSAYGRLGGAQNFEELDSIKKQQEALESMQEATCQAEGMMVNVVRDPNMSIDEKPGAIQKIMTGLVDRIRNFSTKVMKGESNHICDGLTEDSDIKDALSKLDSEKQVTKTDGGIQYHASDYAVVPDPEMPSTWKLRLAEGRSGNFTVAQVARAITAMQPGGFRGQRVQLTGEEKTQAVSRIGAAINKTDGDDNQKQNLRIRLDRVKEITKEIKAAEVKSNFWITKDAQGDMLWVGFPSNKWRDRDNPPQIISEAAHKDFVEYLERTKDYPVLLGWHTPGTEIGKATWAEYDHGFLIMGGIIDKDKHAEAERLAELTTKEAIGMSHGFVYSFADEKNQIIGKYRTWEVSHLPLKAAANVWTDINVIKRGVEKMAFDDTKRAYLNETYGAGFVENIENKTADLEKDLLSAGLEFKDLNLVDPEVKESDPMEVAQKAATLIVESESFTNIVKQLTDIGAELTAIKETTIPALEQKITEANVKAQKSHDDIIADAMKSKAGAFQASKEGPEPTEKESKESGPEYSPIDMELLGAMTNMSGFDGQTIIAQ